jgi:hypothetical protein
MGEVINMSGKPPEISDEVLLDLCRYSEGILTQVQVRKRHRLPDSVWEQLDDDLIVEKIEDLKLQRIRSGACKREKAQGHMIRGVDVLNTIASDPAANNKHKIDAIRTMDAIASPPAAVAAADAARFVIQIDLSADGSNVVERFSKSITALKPNEVDPDDPDTDNMMLAAIAARKPDGNDGNQGHL